MVDSAEQIVLIGSDGRRVTVTRSIATEASYVLRDLLDGREACKDKEDKEAVTAPQKKHAKDDLESSTTSSSGSDKANLLEVPIPFITGEILEQVWEHMKYRFYTAVAVDDAGNYGLNVYPIPMKTIPKPMTLPLVEYLDSKDRKFIQDWDEKRTILMVKAATLLRYEELLQLASARLATFLLEKNTEGIRTLLGVECDFSTDEINQLKKEEVVENIMR